MQNKDTNKKYLQLLYQMKHYKHLYTLQNRYEQTYAHLYATDFILKRKKKYEDIVFLFNLKKWIVFLHTVVCLITF